MNQNSPIPSHWRTLAAHNPGSVLLETTRSDASNKRSLLFLEPVHILSASTPAEMPEVFRRIEEGLAAGFYAAGFLGYECGYHFQAVAHRMAETGGLPLLWFGLYRDPLIHEHGVSTSISVGEAESVRELWASDGNLSLGIPEDVYRAKIEKIKEYIAAGDTYQVNFTDRIHLRTAASAMEIFTALSHRQPVPHSAFLNLGGQHILSFSPELFFQVKDGRILARPMKGTMPRGLDSAEDDSTPRRLQSDEKNRAEHVMIVDLIRNDLGRLCTMGSVQVEELFSVEKYRTLFQMTSTVTGELRPALSYYEIFQSMFPSGSITGAPKMRTMEIIRDLEARARGIYTGAIGYIAPDRSSIFNVAIRTLVLKDGLAQMGVGGGIVADSSADDEYRECLLKTSFLRLRPMDFKLIETMLWDRSPALLAMHLDRMESSAAYFEFPFDRLSVTAELLELSNSFAGGMMYRVRLLLDSAGKTSIQTTAFEPEVPTGHVLLCTERTDSRDVFLRHKTTRRDRYDRMYAEARAAGMDEVLFLNENDEVTEGAISNIFIRREGRLFTPPLRSGVLPGVFRRYLLETEPAAGERVLRLEDLKSADEVFLCNSVRGKRQVQSLWPNTSRQNNLLAR